MARVRIDSRDIVDWPSFHAAWQSALGFPSYYGANLNAWVDCLSSLRDVNASGMARVCLEPDEVLFVELTDAEAWRRTCPDIVAALWDSTAFVNRRYADAGEPAAIVLVPIDSSTSESEPPSF